MTISNVSPTDPTTVPMTLSPKDPTGPMALPMSPPPPNPTTTMPLWAGDPTEVMPTPIPSSSNPMSAVEPGPRNGPAPKAGWLRGRWWSTLLALALIGISLLIDAEGLAIVPVIFILVVPFEKMFPRHRQQIRRPHLLTDLGYALAGSLLNIVGLIAAIPVAILSLAWIPGLMIRPLVGAIPGPLVPILGVALFDLAIYWTHRWYHEVPFLWRFHAIHHSTERLDWISGFRNHPLDGTLVAPPAIFLLAAGFGAELTGVLAVLQIVIGLFLHANVRWRLRPFHKLIITPEFHHWHHANEPGAINSNYSVFLPGWDLLFGTYFMPADRRPQRYGVSEPIPKGMVGQLRHPFRGMAPAKVVVKNAFRHPITSTKFSWRLLCQHVFRPIRRIGVRRHGRRS